MAILQQIKFLTSAAELKQIPIDSGSEIAFMGRSNAGKSSTINAITNIKRLAYASKMPGRTQLLNFFQVGDGSDKRLVDLPGYGYAKTSSGTQKNWQKILGEYLQHRQSLKGIILVIDIRRGLMPGDCMVVEWCYQAKIPLHILLNKADKLSHNQITQAIKKIYADVSAKNEVATVQPFSALRKTGIDDVISKLTQWLD